MNVIVPFSCLAGEGDTGDEGVETKSELAKEQPYD